MPEPEEPYQFKLKIEQQLFNRLERLGAKLGYPSANKFAVAALDQYAELLADLMAELTEDQNATRKRQRERLLGRAAQPSESITRRK